MKQYYYFVTSLPKITFFDTKLPISPDEFILDLLDVIDPKDMVCLTALRSHFDNINLINRLENRDEFFPFGNFTKEELIEEIKDPQHLLPYIQDFLEKKNFNERSYPYYSLENELTLLYYNYLLSLPYPFLTKFIKFDYDLKNFATALSTRKFKVDRSKNILKLHSLYENLLHNNSPDFGLGYNYDWLYAYIEMFEKNNLHDRELKLIEMRFKFIDEELTYDYFSFNQIIAFYLKLFLLQRKVTFDEIKGRNIFEKVTNELSNEQNIFKDLNN